MTQDFTVRLMPMPPRIKGYVIKTLEDDYYTIILNSNLNHEQNLQTYWHELKHIIYGDLDEGGDADLIERLRHA